mmetsp:Transcript_37891/g.74187  ORF Transcript_37891/g.74187 Transcript_37891/m.74187 type:complete len:253 (+) Transcript_37891:506-1264(+)
MSDCSAFTPRNGSPKNRAASLTPIILHGPSSKFRAISRIVFPRAPNMPITEIDSPEIFGLHPNADLTFRVKEATSLFHTLGETQPKEFTSIEHERHGSCCSQYIRSSSHRHRTGATPHRPAAARPRPAWGTHPRVTPADRRPPCARRPARGCDRARRDAGRRGEGHARRRLRRPRSAPPFRHPAVRGGNKKNGAPTGAPTRVDDLRRRRRVHSQARRERRGVREVDARSSISIRRTLSLLILHPTHALSLDT